MTSSSCLAWSVPTAFGLACAGPTWRLRYIKYPTDMRPLWIGATGLKVQPYSTCAPAVKQKPWPPCCAPMAFLPLHTMPGCPVLIAMTINRGGSRGPWVFWPAPLLLAWASTNPMFGTLPMPTFRNLQRGTFKKQEGPGGTDSRPRLFCLQIRPPFQTQKAMSPANGPVPKPSAPYCRPFPTNLRLAQGAVMEDPQEVWIAPLADKPGCTLQQARKSLDLMARAGWLDLHPVRSTTCVKWLHDPISMVERPPEVGSDGRILAALLARHGREKRPGWTLDSSAVFAQAGCSENAGWQHLKRLAELSIVAIASPTERAVCSIHICPPLCQHSPRASCHPRGPQARFLGTLGIHEGLSGILRVAVHSSWNPCSMRDAAAPCGICDRCAPPSPPTEQDIEVVDRPDGILICRTPAPWFLSDAPDGSRSDTLEQWRAQGRVTWKDGMVFKVAQTVPEASTAALPCSHVGAVPSYPFVHLHPGKEKSLLRGHPWVFSGAIQRIEVDDAAPSPGDWVCVMSSKGQALGWGHWGAGSIAVRIIASGTLDAPPQAHWWVTGSQNVWPCDNPWDWGRGQCCRTDCCRLVHGEGDGLSGLVVDWYAGMAVVQTHSMGMHRAWPDLSAGLRAALGHSLRPDRQQKRLTHRQTPWSRGAGRRWQWFGHLQDDHEGSAATAGP